MELGGGERKSGRAESSSALALLVTEREEESRETKRLHVHQTQHQPRKAQSVLRNKSHNKGLISADRRTKPTLTLTIPR